MTHLYFHCTGPGEVLVDCQGIEVLDLDEARDHALSVARAIVEENFGRGDFSEWIVFVLRTTRSCPASSPPIPTQPPS